MLGHNIKKNNFHSYNARQGRNKIDFTKCKHMFQLTKKKKKRWRSYFTLENWESKSHINLERRPSRAQQLACLS